MRKYTHKFLELVISSHLKHIAPSQNGFIFSIPKNRQNFEQKSSQKTHHLHLEYPNNQTKMDGHGDFQPTISY